MDFIDGWVSKQEGFQLDIVGFLAILGEGSVESLAQVAMLSNLVYVPRLIPAPQIFIRPQRSEKFETVGKAEVIGVHSGNVGETIHHIAHALHRGDKLKPNTVTCVRIEEDENIPRPSPRRFGPLALLVFLGFALSATNLGLAIYYEDGMALLATVVLSLLSTTVSIANKWSPTPNNPKPDPHSPPGDVVIRYPHGAFIIVSCKEPTARYLYFNASEHCIYLIESTTLYRALSLISTLLLMGGVISLANARVETQIGFAGSYMLINVFYWIGAALPPAQHWDLRRLKVREIELSGGSPPASARMDNENPTYTVALWKAIAATGTASWLRETSGWIPRTPAWKAWMEEAEDNARAEEVQIQMIHDEKGNTVQEIWKIRNWNCRHALSTHLRTNTSKFEGA